ncbi:MAG: S4 domain-containing protein, partial [Candidatus Nitrotoga sp.]
MNNLRKESVTYIKIDEGSCNQRIDNFLCKHLKGVPKSHIYRILRSGEVRVDKKRVDQTYRLQLGDQVRIPPVRVAEAQNRDYIPALEFPILFEDDA